MKLAPRWLWLLALLLIISGGLSAAAAQTDEQTNVTIILDASGSMQALFSDGRTRIEIAKDAVINLASSLPAQDNASLWVYGHRLPQDDPEASCLDIEQVIPLAPVDPVQFEQVVTPLNAIGYTPIARSLENAVTGTPPNSHNIVVLMSDGEESCGGDPCAVAGELVALGFEVVINTIGVAPDANTRAQLQCIAQITGGAYYEANDAGALTEALQEASAPPPPETGMIQVVTPDGEVASQIGFEVLNPTDNTSMGSRLGSGEFPPGNYTVRVSISPLLETNVTVTAGETTTITLPDTGTVRLVDSEGVVTDLFPFTLYDPETGQAVAYSSGGTAEVPAGAYNAVVNSNPVFEQPITLAPGETVDIPLNIGGIQIVTEDGQPTTDYYFFVTNAETGELVTGTTGPANVAPGIYNIVINTTPRTETQVTVTAGETVNIPVGAVGSIQTVNEDGEPISDYYYFVNDAETGELVTGGVGLIEIAPGIYDVLVNTVPPTETQVTVAAGETVEIPIGGVGSIQTVNDAGEPISDYYYFVNDAETGELVTGGVGLIEVAPGIYDVLVNTVPPTETQVTVTIGETVDVVVGTPGSLQTVTDSGEPTADFYYYVNNAETGELVTGGVGLVELAPGTYDVEISTLPSTEVQQVIVVAGETTDVSLPPMGTLEVFAANGSPNTEYLFIYDAETGDLVTGGVDASYLLVEGVYRVEYPDGTTVEVEVVAGETARAQPG